MVAGFVSRGGARSFVSFCCCAGGGGGFIGE